MSTASIENNSEERNTLPASGIVSNDAIDNSGGEEFNVIEEIPVTFPQRVSCTCQ